MELVKDCGDMISRQISPSILSAKKTVFILPNSVSSQEVSGLSDGKHVVISLKNKYASLIRRLSEVIGDSLKYAHPVLFKSLSDISKETIETIKDINNRLTEERFAKEDILGVMSVFLPNANRFERSKNMILSMFERSYFSQYKATTMRVDPDNGTRQISFDTNVFKKRLDYGLSFKKSEDQKFMERKLCQMDYLHELSHHHDFNSGDNFTSASNSPLNKYFFILGNRTVLYETMGEMYADTRAMLTLEKLFPGENEDVFDLLYKERVGVSSCSHKTIPVFEIVRGLIESGKISEIKTEADLDSYSQAIATLGVSKLIKDNITFMERDGNQEWVKYKLDEDDTERIIVNVHAVYSQDGDASIKVKNWKIVRDLDICSSKILDDFPLLSGISPLKKKQHLI